MRGTVIFLVVLSLVVATPGALAEHNDEHDEGPPRAAHYGLCTAQDASAPGNEASNGTVNETPPFSNLTKEDCEDAQPGDGTPAEDRAPEDPGQPENPGAPETPDPPETPGPPENPGPPEDPGPPETPAPPAIPAPPENPGEDPPSGPP